MKQALQLARRGIGRTAPNPVVGAVLVKKGTVVGEGYHAKAGEAHAEIIAMEKAGPRAEGSTLYINLEPCSHYGKTPPCAPVVAKAGIKKVVMGMVDPNPLVRGEGVSILKRAGIDVHIGILEKECRRLNEAFCKYIVKKEPFVILKVAATLDGKVATRQGESKWISSEASRRLVHRLRNEADAVLVGIGTVLKDDPLLTARIPGGRDPYRIILDSRLSIPETARVIGLPSSRTIIATTELARRDKIERLEKSGAQVLILKSTGGEVDLKHLLLTLGGMGIMSLLVEGGSRTNGAFFDAGLIDKLLLFLSPRIIGGGEAPGMLGGRGVEHLTDSAFLNGLRLKRVGGDILIEGYVKSEVGPCSPES